MSQLLKNPDFTKLAYGFDQWGQMLIIILFMRHIETTIMITTTSTVAPHTIGLSLNILCSDSIVGGERFALLKFSATNPISI